MKKCFKCKKSKELYLFYVHSKMSDGHLGKCKECVKESVRENYSKNRLYYQKYDIDRQRSSFRRIFRHRYSGMLARIEGRATRTYAVENRDIATREDFLMWCNKNIISFKKIYYIWKKSGWENKLSPSIDRIDNNKGYTLDNIQWLSKKDNVSKYTL